MIRLKGLTNESFVLLDEMYCRGRLIVGSLERQAYTPGVCFCSAQSLTVRCMLALSHGGLLIAEMAARADIVPGLRYRELQGAFPSRTLAVVWDKQRSLSALARTYVDVSNGARSRRAGRQRAPCFGRTCSVSQRART